MKSVGLLMTIMVSFVLLLSCAQEQEQPVQLFNNLSPKSTGVSFINRINETEEINYFTYPYLYMGGGVAIGDINNDGLQDIYFTSNMGENKLYLNKGQMQFEDISAKAKVQGDGRWHTGVVMADFNADGHIDIYVCVSGKWESTENQLFINNGDLTFTEMAKEMGLADAGHSTQSTLIDYDRDGDMDVYVANYPPLDFKAPNFVYSQNARVPKLETSDRLYRNDSGRFVDVTVSSGVLNFGLSLSATSADFNNDGWSDIYISNDFASPDILYINNKNGTFSNQITKSTNHTAFYGMGTDAADINNDGLIDIFQVDMTPEDNYRSKVNMASMNPSSFYEMIDLGLHYQYMENAFQLNYGNNEWGVPRFGDISRITGTSLTDWSWSPLIADFDNDGWKDIHVTNGTRRDINNKDYFKSLEKYPNKASLSDLEKSQNIPFHRVDNYTFKNNGDLNFSNETKKWGLSFEGFSNGSAYGDLDNDGDLDIVVNNIDDPASIFENKTTNGWLRVKFDGPADNKAGIGAKVELRIGSTIQSFTNSVTRGFQSASEPIAHFGIGSNDRIDELMVTWPDGHISSWKDLTPNQHIEASWATSSQASKVDLVVKKTFTLADSSLGIDYTHNENEHNDFEKEPLLPHATSKYGPGLSVGDINKDGREDFYVGGAKGSAGALFIQIDGGKFQKLENTSLSDDKEYEDVGALFFDANNDGWDDLYVVSGGNEATQGDKFYQDRLYLNHKGNLIRDYQMLPDIRESGSRVKSYDFDQDGDMDLLVGGRMVPKSYGYPAKSTLLRNDQKNGQTVFTDVTTELAPALLDVGMVTDFVWTDFNADGNIDLVLVGEWMPVTFMENTDGHFNVSELTDVKTRGWWFSIAAADLDANGHVDIVLGNLGQNYKYQATDSNSFDLYLDDFDHNKDHDIVLGYYNNGTQFPVRGRQCSSQQIPEIEQKFKNYDAFAKASLIDVYGENSLQEAQIHYQVESFASEYWLNKGNNAFDRLSLPVECQISAINSILIEDMDQDGHLDLLFSGNLFSSEVETKRNDSSIGQLLKGDGNGNFRFVPFSKSGFMASKDAKDMTIVNTPHDRLVLVANNDDKLEVFKMQ